MNIGNPSFSDSVSIVQKDLFLTMSAVFIALVVLMFPHLHEPTKTEESAVVPGNMTVEAHWDDSIDADVDLYVKSPGGSVVSYLNKSGTTFNLLRDDLGFMNDTSGQNYEFLYSRGAPIGEYIVNLHLYRNKSDVVDIEVVVVISMKNPVTKVNKEMLTKKVVLRGRDHEITVTRFVLDDKYRIEAGSEHSTYVPLRKR